MQGRVKKWSCFCNHTLFILYHGLESDLSYPYALLNFMNLAVNQFVSENNLDLPECVRITISKATLWIRKNLCWKGGGGHVAEKSLKPFNMFVCLRMVSAFPNLIWSLLQGVTCVPVCGKWCSTLCFQQAVARISLLDHRDIRTKEEGKGKGVAFALLESA